MRTSSRRPSRKHTGPTSSRVTRTSRDHGFSTASRREPSRIRRQSRAVREKLYQRRVIFEKKKKEKKPSVLFTARVTTTCRRDPTCRFSVLGVVASSPRGTRYRFDRVSRARRRKVTFRRCLGRDMNTKIPQYSRRETRENFSAPPVTVAADRVYAETAARPSSERDATARTTLRERNRRERRQETASEFVVKDKTLVSRKLRPVRRHGILIIIIT